MTHVLNIKLYNLDTSESSDITADCMVKSASFRLNQASSFAFQVPANADSVTAAFGDGQSAATPFLRKVYVTRDGDPIIHNRIFGGEWAGDGTTNWLTLTSFDAFMELGYEADGRAGRPVRDATGNFVSPVFNSGGSATGGDLVQQVLTNSIVVGAENPGPGGEGPLPIDLTTGTFDLSGTDLSPIDTMDWPVLIGDFITQLTDSGVCDVVMRPVAPSEGLDSYAMVAASAVNSYGTDVSGTVHFDYWTGSKNAKACRITADGSTVCNKLYDYLGPRNPSLVDGTGNDPNQWRGNITPGSPGTTVDPTDSRAAFGTFMQIRVFDSIGTENSSRPLYLALWNEEAGLRLAPQNLFFITPSPDSEALYEPWDDYWLGDLVTFNIAPELAGAISASFSGTFRIIGIDVEWDRNGVERVTQIITSLTA